MLKTVLTLDEINLLRESEEPKKEEFYGNLYDILCSLKNPKAISLAEMPLLNEKGVSALTYNKKTLMESVIAEWYAESVSDFDSDKEVRCGLCNTPNKYIYYIRNRINNNTLNVGSTCIQKFPGISGYTERRKQLNSIVNNNRMVERRNAFHDAIPDIDLILEDCNTYLDSIPIAIPFGLYYDIKDTIVELRQIYNSYIKNGKYKTGNVYDRFNREYSYYNILKGRVKDHINVYGDNQFICRKPEMDWLSENNERILIKIQSNNGLYDIETIKHVYSESFVKEKIKQIMTHADLVNMNVLNIANSSVRISYSKSGYNNDIVMSIPLSSFMSQIGSRALFEHNYEFNDKDLINIAIINNSSSNLQSIILYIKNILIELGYALLIDYDRDSLILYKIEDKSIRQFSPQAFMNSYKNYLYQNDNAIKTFLIRLTGGTKAKWTSFEDQEKYDTASHISELYNDQWIE